MHTKKRGKYMPEAKRFAKGLSHPRFRPPSSSVVEAAEFGLRRHPNLQVLQEEGIKVILIGNPNQLPS